MDWRTTVAGIVTASSMALVGVMIWRGRKSSLGAINYADIEDIPATRIAQEAPAAGSYKPKSATVTRRKNQKSKCSPVTPLRDTHSNTEILKCGGEPLGTVHNAEDIYKFAKGQTNLLQEEFVVLSMDSRNNILASSVPHRGTASEVYVNLSDTFRVPVILGAPRIALVHNHPSGSPVPGQHDLAMTKKAIAAGQLLGIAVLDHVVVGSDGYMSLRDFMGSDFK